MRFHQCFLAVAFCAVIPTMCSSQPSQAFLTWNISINANNREAYFSQDKFTEFYNCLCGQFSKQCQAQILPSDEMTFTAGKSNGSDPVSSSINRYVCSFSKNDINPIVINIDCSKVNLNDYDCSNTNNCVAYFVNDSLPNINCALASVELSLAQGVSVQPTYYDGINNLPSLLNIKACSPGCSSSSPSSSFTTTATLPLPHSSSGLTNEYIIIIGLAVGLAILIVALIILGVIVWRRRHKSRDQVQTNDITARTLTNHVNNGTVNYGGNSASPDIIHLYSTSKASTTPEMGTKDIKNQYETVDLNPDPEQGILTKSSIKSNNGSSIKSSDSKKRALPAVLESPYSEPETTHVTGSYSTVDLDDAVGKVTITSDKPENGSCSKLPEPLSKDTPASSENPYSEPETKNLTDPYTGINPNTKSQKKKNTPTPPSKVTDGAAGNVNVSATPGDENYVSNDDSENAYSKLHETQRHFQNPYNILPDPLTDAPDKPPANLSSSNVDIIPETATSTPVLDLPVLKDVVSDNGDKPIDDDDDDAISEPDQSECDSDKSDENRKPDAAMHVSDNEEIKVQTDKGTLEYTGPVKNKTSATSHTETGTTKKNEYFQLESDAESSTEEEEGG